MLMDLTFRKNILVYSRTFKGLSPSTTPFGKRKFIRIVAFTVRQIYLLSIEKWDCENYLFLCQLETNCVNFRTRSCGFSLVMLHGWPKIWKLHCREKSCLSDWLLRNRFSSRIVNSFRRKPWFKIVRHGYKNSSPRVFRDSLLRGEMSW